MQIMNWILTALATTCQLADVLQGHPASSSDCQSQHIDITGSSGVLVEASATSQVVLKGLRFPADSFLAGDQLTVDFQTLSTDGLIFHAESTNGKHELSVWVHSSELRLRVTGNCFWLYLRDLAHDPFNVSDGERHTLLITVKENGLTFKIDNRETRTFYYASSSVFRCWHIEHIYFGMPSHRKTKEGNPYFSPEFSAKIHGCISNFATLKSNITETVTSYHRVSSCPTG